MRYFALIAVMFLGACASVTTGTSQDIAVSTEPPGATCELRREGALVGRADPTPATVRVGKSSRPIEVACEKFGHFSVTEMLMSDFQAMTLGNVLIGGVIGVGIDAASGAMNRYPSEIALDLNRRYFESEAERAWYAERRRTELESQTQAAVEQALEACKLNTNASEEECERQAERARTQGEMRLSRFENDIARAEVGDVPEEMAQTALAPSDAELAAEAEAKRAADEAAETDASRLAADLEAKRLAYEEAKRAVEAAAGVSAGSAREPNREEPSAAPNAGSADEQWQVKMIVTAGSGGQWCTYREQGSSEFFVSDGGTFEVDMVSDNYSRASIAGTLAEEDKLEYAVVLKGGNNPATFKRTALLKTEGSYSDELTFRAPYSSCSYIVEFARG